MQYAFALDSGRLFQYANRLVFDTPYLHASRLLDFHDFLYLLEGEWEIGLAGESHTVLPGDVLILPAGIPHCGIRPCAPGTKILYAHVYPCASDGVPGSPCSRENTVVLNSLIKTGVDPHIRHLFAQILQTKNHPTLSIAYFNALLHELSAFPGQLRDADLAARIHAYAVNAPGIPSNGDIAAHFYISRRTAEIRFKAAYGMSIHEYLLRYRLEQARQYLTDYPDLTLSSLAQTLGFCDEHHLSRSFKALFGVSPRACRKLLRKNAPEADR